MIEVMLQLGGYQFSITSAAYQDLSREVDYRWTAQERIGALDALQFTGVGSDSMELRGVVYPFHRGGLGQIDALRSVAAAGDPLTMVSGTGAVLGRWVILSVREGQAVFAARGLPRRVEFSLRLRKFDEGAQG